MEDMPCAGLGLEWSQFNQAQAIGRRGEVHSQLCGRGGDFSHASGCGMDAGEQEQDEDADKQAFNGRGAARG